VSFSTGTAQIGLTAERDLKKGDELTIAFVDITQHEGETALECRRRRRIELARGWRFACSCSRCEEELPASGPGPSGSGGSGSGMGSGPGSVAVGEESATTTEKKPEEDVGPDLKDESKVDVSVSRFEEAQRLEKEKEETR
jgi:import receptor subunit TOM20